jgi:hypothetical protein
MDDGQSGPSAGPRRIQALYREAFRRFRAIALYNLQEQRHPSPEAALIVARALRYEGNLEARKLAEKIEKACSAAH